MGLLKRISGLVTANLNELVDQCEDPEKMLRQTLREMEAGFGQLMDAAARAIAHHRLLSRQLGEQREAIDHCAKAAEAAVARGDDESARSHLERKAEHQRMEEALSRQITTADALARRLRGQVNAMRVKLVEARRKLVDITARNRAATAQRKLIEKLPVESCRGGVWPNFDALCARIERSEAETAALLDLLGESDAAEPFDAEVEAELRAIKEAAGHVAH